MSPSLVPLVPPPPLTGYVTWESFHTGERIVIYVGNEVSLHPIRAIAAKELGVAAQDVFVAEWRTTILPRQRACEAKTLACFGSTRFLRQAVRL